MPTRTSRSSIWADALELLDRAERLQRQFYRMNTSPRRCPAWEPPVDLFETQDELWIQVALVGVAPNQTEVVYQDGVLTVSGERHWPDESRGATLHRVEIPHGYFERRIELPPGDYAVNRRDLLNGLLTVSLRKLR
jgi:HSP20 family molecular chaperone IbpA